MKKVNIGLLGFGTVGSGVYEILKNHKEELSLKTGYDIEIKRVLVSDLKKDRKIEKDKLTDKFQEIIDDDDIQIVIELIGGYDKAREYIINSLNSGKHVITGNKLAIAKTDDEFFKNAIDNNLFFMHEASVGGGIPVIDAINNEFAGDTITKIIGIINGTTNYILTKMSEEGWDYSEAVKKAQELGYAEADPSSDVDGDDAMYKIAILSKLAYNTHINLSKIYKEGITKLTIKDFEDAKKVGYTIKLLAVSERENNEIMLRVHPALVPLNSMLASVKDAYNAINLTGKNIGIAQLYGQGAGSLPTANAVIADLIKILRYDMKADICTAYNKSLLLERKNLHHKKIDECKMKYYIRIKDASIEDVSYELSDIIEKEIEISNNQISFITKKIKESDISSIIGKFNTESIIRIEE